MTEEEYTKATVCFDKRNKVRRFVEKMKREFPEMEYDPDYKEIYREVMELMDARLTALETELENL